jgi:cell division protein FtsW (lipid II flippase)
MKKMILKSGSKISLLFTSLLLSMLSMAQDDKKIDININAKDKDANFFMQPWVWVVGGAVFILLLIALLKNNNSK